tara:strand:+ start:5258 stop:8332 length:3075 start_codon:yes stop_codon:yes gene_type:complete
MSEKILHALMQLFAIIAKIDEDLDSSSETSEIQSSKGRKIIEGFLKSELSSEYIDKYLNVFNNYLVSTRGRIISKQKDRKRTALHSVKILRICSQINKELTQRQKVIVLVRIMEFIDLDDVITEREIKFAETVADSFHINSEEFDRIRFFIKFNGSEIDDRSNTLYLYNKKVNKQNSSKSAIVEGLDSPIIIIYIESVRSLFFRYLGNEELYTNGRIVSTSKAHVFNIGSTLRTSKSKQIYYSDIITRFTSSNEDLKLTLDVKNVIHSFESGKNAIHKVSLTTDSGNLIGLMGGSGSGKTTLLSIMNGKVKPKYGSVTINGLDVHEQQNLLEGVIGNVSQDDLLIDELTVFENLFFSAKLSIKDISKNQLIRKVNKLLNSLGLYEIRHLKVGSVVQKVISGGQRKRLNIALELIREPSILFVDEPTSGLSSRDSDNIMDLLKELSLNGKLVFVVIHQPSSNIFKLFDRLLIIDKGGYLIYDGIPLDAIVHFKTYSFQGLAHEKECDLCGNVNPEQIFNIIDAKIIDEYGNETNERKNIPEDWNKLYKKIKPTHSSKNHNVSEVKGRELPSKKTQFTTYLMRDFLSKKSNKQYLLINALVSPVLALALSFFIKFFDWSSNDRSYTYFSNDNIPQYIFIAVIVAIFIGMTVSAEEIHKDKKNLVREKFINLSRSSYLLSKIAILFIISAIQSFLFVIIGNSILEIHGMLFEYWFVLFTVSCLSNLIGLNISSAFNSAKVIYIFVPLLIIPQLLFSGVIVKFDKLHPSLSEATKVPWIGNTMASRWAYEALAVEQSTQNKLTKEFLTFRINKSESEWKKNYWVPEIRNQLSILQEDNDNFEVKENARQIIMNEITKEDAKWNGLECKGCIELLKSNDFHGEKLKPIENFIHTIRSQYVLNINKYSDSIREKIKSYGISDYKKLKTDYENDALNKVVTNSMEIKKFIFSNSQIYQNDNPIYDLPSKDSFFSAHFYSPFKYVFGQRLKTFTINLIVLWGMILIGYLFLYYDLLKKGIDKIQFFQKKLKK